MRPPLDLIGAGWRYPLRFSARGGIDLARGEEEILEAIRIILSTPLRSRVMRPEFGCRIHELSFAPINAATLSTAEHYVRDALGYWEPRIEVLDVVAVPDPNQPARLVITLSYRIKATHDERALVFPFYTIPGGAE
ncbi:MAG: GPW/gp25 family protein [Chloroflexales bacterium]|nr:GPW/gp25 family protein [Chloroflexales bacterium]